MSGQFAVRQLAVLTPTVRRALILTTTMLASGMYSLDFTVASLALPHMQGTFSASPDQIAWVVTGFIVGLICSITVVGWASSQIGQRRLFALSIGAFVAITVLCANAGTLMEEVIWRLLLGAAAAPIIPLSQAIAVDAYPRDRYGKALVLWSIGSVVGSIIGPSIGGYLIDLYGWSYAFYINVPLGILALLGTITVVPTGSPLQRRGLDWLGLTALVVGLGALQIMFNRGTRLDWFSSSEIVTELVVGLLCLYVFVARTLLARNPFLRPEPFRDWNYTIGLLGAIMYGTLWSLPTVLLPILLHNYREVPIETVGFLLATRQIGYGGGIVLAGLLVQRVDGRALMALGFATIAWSAWLMVHWSLDVTISSVVWASLLQGAGSAFSFIPLNTAAFSTLPIRHRAESTPLFYLLINVGSGAGIAGIFTFWTASTQVNHAHLVENATLLNPLFRSPNLPEAWGLGSASGIAALNEEITRQAGMIGFNTGLHLVMLASLCAVPLALLFRRAAKLAR